MKLNPEAVRLFRDEEGVKVVIEGEPRKVERICRAFPKTNPRKFVGLLDPEGHEIGLIDEPDRLEPESRDLVEAELKKLYFVPTILEVYEVEARGTGSQWTVQADDGEHTFRIQDREALDGYDAPSILITDENGKRYRIENYWTLDRESRGLMRDLLPDKVLRVRSMKRSR